MLFKLTAAAALGLTLFAPGMAAQTVAEQLQKGIYAQDTAGNLDEAIAIYRRIIEAGQAPRAVAATAQFRLTQALAQKGDLDAAQREFQTLTLVYAEYRELIAGLAKRMAAATLAQRAQRGTATDYTRYRHTATGVELMHANGTSFQGDFDSFDDGHMAVFAGHFLAVSVWLKQETQHPNDLAAAVRSDLAMAAGRRTDLDGWTVRQESVRPGGGTDRQWLSAVADYTDQGKKMVEMLTWYRTTRNRVFFFARVPAEQLDAHQGKFEKMVAAAVIP
jgi:tetratricopeptide (TPR) repeat protein